MRTKAIRVIGAAAAVLLAATACGGRGEGDGTVAQGDCKGQQTVGITDSSIELGGVYPLSGPASAYGEIPKGVRAYFDYLNAEHGGIDGRTVEYQVRDDGYQPPKTVEEVRRLVEQDQVFAIFQTLGTPTSSAVWDYLNQREVPQIFVAGGATKWGADTEHPWTIGWQPSYRAEGRAFAEFVRQEKPDATVAVLYQNDDFGKDLRDNFVEAIGGSGVRVVAEQSYEVTDPTVDPQLRNLANSKADVLLNFSTPKFASQALAGDARNPDWNPLHILSMVANSLSVLKPVGLENVQGVVSRCLHQGSGRSALGRRSGHHALPGEAGHLRPGRGPDQHLHPDRLGRRRQLRQDLRLREMRYPRRTQRRGQVAVRRADRHPAARHHPHHRTRRRLPHGGRADPAFRERPLDRRRLRHRHQ